MSYRPLHFEPHELLPDLTGLETWETLDPVLRADLDDRMLETADEYRDLVWEWWHEYTYINDYATGGARVASGYRGPRCKVGKPFSQHRKGKAFDAHHHMIDGARRVAVSTALKAGLTPGQAQAKGQEAAIKMADQIRAKIREWVAQGRLRHLGGMEIGVSWIHLDVRSRVGGKVVEFNA